MQCPVCKINSLGPINLVNQLPARQCSRCAGISISSNAYMGWLRATGSALPEKPASISVDSAWDADTLKICPDCGHLMRRFKIFPDIEFYLDRCSHCNGIWFDHHEWEALADRNLHDNIHEFFTRPWQDKLHAEEAKSRMEEIYLLKFGAQDYEKAKAVRQWLEDHPQKNMLIAFLQAEDPYKI